MYSTIWYLKPHFHISNNTFRFNIEFTKVQQLNTNTTAYIILIEVSIKATLKDVTLMTKVI